MLEIENYYSDLIKNIYLIMQENRLKKKEKLMLSLIGCILLYFKFYDQCFKLANIGINIGQSLLKTG